MDTGNRTYLPNPRESAGIFSVVFHIWTIPLFRKGNAKILELNDVYQPLRVDRSQTLGHRLEHNYNKQKADKPSLLRAITTTFWREFLIMQLLYFVTEVLIRLLQPFLLGRLLLFFREGSDMSYDEALVYATVMSALVAIYGIGSNHYYMNGNHSSMKVRVAVCNLIYKKSLRLSQTALCDTSPGKMVNLLSNDLNRFDLCIMLMSAIWGSPLITLIAAILLWNETGWAGMIGLTIIFTVAPLMSYMGKFSSKFRLRTAICTDERVRFMGEIISGIQVIKMYAWERPFAKVIAASRRLELQAIMKMAYIRAIYMAFCMFTTRTALFCTMIAMIPLYGQQSLTVDKIFKIATLFNAISYAMTQAFARSVAETAETIAAIKRLQRFLDYEEKIVHSDSNKDEKLESQQLAVSVKGATASWAPCTKMEEVREEKPMLANGIELNQNNWRPPALQGIDLDIPKGILIGIVGPVAAGKSSLLQALLHELPLNSGSFSINGSISYACQEPWVFAGSVRQNILFGQEMDRKHYNAVVKSCDLARDLKSFENGDLTMVGERGASLSGGQKARINLARAIYRKADIYLLDDPLSAVDAHVGLHLFNECLGPKGQLARQNATRILVTHQVHFLKEADWVVIMRDGKIEVQGTNSDIQESGVDFSSLLASFDKEEKFRAGTPSENIAPEPGNRNRIISGTVLKQIGSHVSIYSRKSLKEEENSVGEEQVEEMHALEDFTKLNMKGPLLLHYFKAAEHPVVFLIMFIFSILAQVFASGADYWVAYWTRVEEQRTYYSHNYYFGTNTSVINATGFRANGSFTRDYYISIGHILPSTNTCAWIQGCILITLFCTAMTRSVTFYRLCVAITEKLHNSMFKGIISTTMRFFDTNPSGRIMNRFSKDIGAIDEYLPKTILDAMQINLSMIGSFVVTLIANPLMILPIIIMSLMITSITRIYLRSSKNVKRLEGITKSPVFTHIAASISGLSTIRAFNAENILLDEFDKHQDLHTACWYMFIISGSGFGMAMDIMMITFVFCVIFAFLLFDTGVSGDKVGLAITQSIALTGLLQYGIKQSAEAANQLTAVERALEYRNLEPEKDPDGPWQPSPEWPSNGQIEFRNVFYKYFDKSEPVLRGLTFSIRPKEKIGIVGRTGAGKSSVIGSLFRLGLVEGKILIDDIDTSKLRLKDLRSKIAIIPQDPVLFSGTLKRNLDPFDEYTDDDIWKALEDVELKDIAHGLEMPVMAHGSNFSVGQRQLLCLARAILRSNRILVLDEATANVDPHTDLLIQQTIREKFADCTVITIAHRLHTIIDSDRVLVMDAGQAVEFDSAYTLLQKESGILKSMVEALGAQEIERLNDLAKEKYLSCS